MHARLAARLAMTVEEREAEMLAIEAQMMQGWEAIEAQAKLNPLYEKLKDQLDAEKSANGATSQKQQLAGATAERGTDVGPSMTENAEEEEEAERVAMEAAEKAAEEAGAALIAEEEAEKAVRAKRKATKKGRQKQARQTAASSPPSPPTASSPPAKSPSPPAPTLPEAPPDVRSSARSLSAEVPPKAEPPPPRAPRPVAPPRPERRPSLVSPSPAERQGSSDRYDRYDRPSRGGVAPEERRYDRYEEHRPDEATDKATDEVTDEATDERVALVTAALAVQGPPFQPSIVALPYRWVGARPSAEWAASSCARRRWSGSATRQS